MKPSLPKGTRDFLPIEVRRRQYIFDTIKEVFELYGYNPLETPAMERLDVLMGKYGDEGDKLLFKILNNGDFLEKADLTSLVEKKSKELIPQISKRGLKYDLTVPFARFVVMNQHQIQFPFKRYQIQPVWRADRPQKGRYQEFYQCDADIVGSESIMYEAELVTIYDQVFSKLNINVEIKYNHRKILYAIAEAVGLSGQFVQFTTIVDKIDKIGLEQVLVSLNALGMNSNKNELLFQLLTTSELSEIKNHLDSSVEGKRGINEIQIFQQYLNSYKSTNDIVFDPSLARGLGYYTGCVFEVMAKDVKMGSIGGGGRYANLTANYGMKNVSGVGISFGAERIYDVLLELGAFEHIDNSSSQVLIICLDQDAHYFGYECVMRLREQKIRSDIYPKPVKLKKQLKYANDIKVDFVIIIGSEELQTGRITLKDMNSGVESKYSLEEIIDRLKQ